MTPTQFLRIAELTCNTTWVRTYLATFPGLLVLEVANLDGADLDALRSDLLAAGFESMGTRRRSGIEVARFSIRRDDAQAASETA